MKDARDTGWLYLALAAAAVLVVVLLLRPGKPPAPAGAPPPLPEMPVSTSTKTGDAKPGFFQLQLVAGDGRAVTSCRVVSLESRRVVASFDGASGGPPKVDLELSGDVQRLLLLPEDPALAPVLAEVDRGQAKYGPVAAVFPPGLETSGVVVDSRGEPLAGVAVSAEIPFDPDLAAKDGPFTELPRKGGTYGFNESVLSVRTTTDGEGRFHLDGLPASVTKLRVVHGKSRVEHAVSEAEARIVIPDGAGK